MRTFGQSDTLFGFLVTIFLFVKSDIKTTLVPITILSVSSAPLCTPDRIFPVVWWIFLHLLQFDTSNQILDVEEDAKNKPVRPLPAGRISLRHATILRWGLVPACWIISALHGGPVLLSSMALVLFTVLYNELQANRHWLTKNIVTAIGFASFEVGGTLIAGCHTSHMDAVGRLSVAISTAVFATTIHAQDFKDEAGDRLIGRLTLPIVSPQVGRASILPLLVTWSIALGFMWQLTWAYTVLLLCFSMLVGVRFLLMRSRTADQTSFLLYNMWLSVVHMLPGYWRYLQHRDI
ncbi:UbiA prenyltransferase family [Suillus clintonianus]|uniref:UbiA prenyltransferase family n=1 Tax=Suillus clintonianus TaxID=1904413 RepID=UPI001B879433|nr:UbiA prenyltransferase family [Suillus clintonianus]KAG2125487.1 UbiA prenyltransferase family [Suillus clintonianus]